MWKTTWIPKVLTSGPFDQSQNSTWKLEKTKLLNCVRIINIAEYQWGMIVEALIAV
jgi:hypothetical protein